MGPPLTLAAGRELMEDLMVGNLPGSGTWQSGGIKIDPTALTMPILNILSTTDRITPAASAWTGGDRVALEEGHVGMVVGSKAPGSLWVRLCEWISAL